MLLRERGLSAWGEGRRRRRCTLVIREAMVSGDSGDDDDFQDDDGAVLGGSLLLLGFLALMLGCGIAYRGEIEAVVTTFAANLDGPTALAQFAVVYLGLELLAVPAIPLTLSAGALFGVVKGTAVVSFSSVMAATCSFLIARYGFRDRFQRIAATNTKWAAIDKAVAKEGFRVITLLRLSPLLPFALSNYLFGLTSVDLVSYVLGSWIGMFPGTLWYVSAGKLGGDLWSGGVSSSSWGIATGLAAGVGFSVLTAGYIGRIVKGALDTEAEPGSALDSFDDDLEEEEEALAEEVREKA